MGIDHARQRVTFGEPIANYQAIQWKIADSAVEIEALRWLMLYAAWRSSTAWTPASRRRSPSSTAA